MYNNNNNNNNKILLLGLGNILLHDEGIGVHVVNHIIKNYNVSKNVSVIDGGTLGMSLLPYLEETDACIVVDVISSQQPPGTILQLSSSEVSSRISAKQSFHQSSFLEVLSYAELLNILPKNMVFLCIVPQNISPWGVELSDPCKISFDNLVEQAIKQIKNFGGECFKLV